MPEPLNLLYRDYIIATLKINIFQWESLHVKNSKLNHFHDSPMDMHNNMKNTIFVHNQKLINHTTIRYLMLYYCYETQINYIYLTIIYS